jgi:hypothetical protein
VISYFAERTSYWVSLMFSHDEIEVVYFWQEYHISDVVPTSVADHTVVLLLVTLTLIT